jgi:competence protein ComEC
MAFVFSRQLMIFLLSFLGGVFLRSFWNFPFFFWLELGTLAFFFFFLFPSGNHGRIFFFLFLGLALGLFRFQLAEDKLEAAPLREHYFEMEGVEGWVCQEREVFDQEQRLVLCLSKLGEEGGGREVLDRLQLKTSLYPSYNYGDRLQAVGLIQPPPENQASSFALQGITAVMENPWLEKLPGEEGFWLKKFFLRLKSKSQLTINQSLNYPPSALLKALLLGDRSEISFLFKNQLAAVGLIHLLAISGLHLVILSQLVFLFLRSWRLKDPWPALLTLIFLWLFVFLIGNRASLNRAAIMSSFLLIGEIVRRPVVGLRSLVWAAAFLLFLNPFSLRSDVGFQLSFLAALGLVWLKPLLVSRKRLSFIGEVFWTTLAAQLLVFPRLLSLFGQVSLVSPLSNLLVVPFLPLIFGLGFIFLLLALISPVFFPLGSVLLGPLFWYLIKIVEELSSWPGIVWSGELFLGIEILFYLGVLFLFFFLDPLRLFHSPFPFQISRRC